MTYSSINFQKSKSHSFKHNFRIDLPNYLLPKKYRLNNENWKHKKSPKSIFESELKNAKRKGGRIPKLENSLWEAVLNLNKFHSLDDVKKVAEHIEKKFNIICTSITLHKDEGYINEDGKPIYNYHSHLNFMTYKDSKQNWRREHIKPQNLSELQTEIANILDMKRGRENSKVKRLEHREFKLKKQIENELKKNFEFNNVITNIIENLEKFGDNILNKFSSFELKDYEIEVLKKHIETVPKFIKFKDVNNSLNYLKSVKDEVVEKYKTKEDNETIIKQLQNLYIENSDKLYDEKEKNQKLKQELDKQITKNKRLEHQINKTKELESPKIGDFEPNITKTIKSNNTDINM